MVFVPVIIYTRVTMYKCETKSSVSMKWRDPGMKSTGPPMQRPLAEEKREKKKCRQRESKS